jgi:putative ABC transport system substrate-binding protein
MNICRKLIVTLLTLVIVCAASISRAQPRIPLVAALFHGTESAYRGRLDAFRDGMRELGYVEGKNYRMEVRWSDTQLDRLPALARELLQLRPDVAVASPVLATQAFNRESKIVPIVMAGGVGALRLGLIESMARPGGNVTGVSNQGDDLTQKLFQLVKEIAPRAKRVIALSSGQGAAEPDARSASRDAAKAYGMTLIDAWADSPETIRKVSALCEQKRCEALVFLLDPYFTSRRTEVIALATKLRRPAVYSGGSEFVEDGGLIGYSADPRALFHRTANYVDKILKGAKPADLPVEQPTRFDIVVNLKTAKTLGVKIPDSILVQATRVIE